MASTILFHRPRWPAEPGEVGVGAVSGQLRRSSSKRRMILGKAVIGSTLRTRILSHGAKRVASKSEEKKEETL